MLHTNFVEIGQLVREKKIFEGVLPYMDVLAILTQMPPTNIVPSTHRGSIQNLALIGHALSEMFEIVDDRCQSMVIL